MKLATDLAESVRAFIVQVPDLNAYQVQTYCSREFPVNRNLREVMNGLYPDSVLIAYLGCQTGQLGQGFHWVHRFSIFLNFSTVDQNLATVAKIINGKPVDNYLPFLESVIDEDCDPPSEVAVTPQMLSDSLEIWEITFSLRECL